VRNAPIEVVKILKETVSICGDAQHPLPHGPPNHWVAAALTDAVNNLQKKR
jgi:hypothetical protein